MTNRSWTAGYNEKEELLVYLLRAHIANMSRIDQVEYDFVIHTSADQYCPFYEYICTPPQTHTHLLPLVLEVGEEVSIWNKLSNETERLLQSHTANHVDNVAVVAFSYLLHHVYLCQEISPLLTI